MSERRLDSLLLLSRSLLFLFVVFHLNRYADGLVPVLFFLPFYLAAMAAGFYLARRRLRLIPAAVALAIGVLLVWFLASGLFTLLRALIDSPRIDALPTIFEFFFLPTASTVSLAFFFAYLATRFRRFPVYEAFALALLAFLVFLPQGEYRLTLYSHPIWVVALALLMLLGVLTVLSTSRRIEDRKLGDDRTAAGVGRLRRLGVLLLLLLPVAFLSILYIYNGYAEGALEEGGGLLRPTLFRFDFSDYLSLESEISLNRDLVLLYHEEGAPANRLLRRYVLSGYSGSRGFYRERDGFDNVPNRLGSGPRRYEGESDEARTPLDQEYYIVNFDPTSLVAVNYPVRVAPLENWQDSSFNGIYRVESEVSQADSGMLSEVSGPGTQSRAWMEYYTAGGGSPILRQLAEEVTASAEGYYEKVRAIEDYLQEEYFYSLRPGVAPDGDQLSHFLFDSRKGYCSYFAFSMALMTRSLGIPSRVAVGFFLDPRQEVLNFYPVRANMAHAWVEVYFDRYGWIEFDPTSQQLAPGEDFDLSMGANQDEVSELLEEIFSRYEELAERGGEELLEAEGGEAEGSLLRQARRLLPVLAPLGLILLLALHRNRYALAAHLAREPRKEARFLFRHAAGRICATLPPREPPFRWPSLLPEKQAAAVEALLPGYQRSLFAPRFGADDVLRLREGWKALRSGARRHRKLLSLFVPLPLFGASPDSREEKRASRGESGRRGGAGVRRSLLIILGATALVGGVEPPLTAQELPLAPEEVESAADILDRAWRAIDNENYEEAIRLLQRGQQRFPEVTEISLLLGDLFYDRELYTLALDSYRQAEEEAPGDYDVLYSVATAYGRLNQERRAISYLERLDTIHEAGPEVVSDLGWLYFKTHQLEKGEQRLLEALEQQGEDRYLTMTLGTIYADMYRYEESRRWYLNAIESALRDGADTFASVAYYNLSLLEKSFYNFEDALRYTDSSIELAERPSGYLARGELYEQQMNGERTYQSYQSAYVLDDETPLPKLSLAALYQRYGRLEDALAYASEILEEENRGWMYNFGTDLSRHAMDIHGLLSDVYKGLGRTRWINRERSLQGLLLGVFDRLRYGVLGWYHDVVYRRAAMRSADAYYEEGSTLNAYWTYRVAYDRRPRIALDYLRRARRFETDLIPESAPFYQLHEAVLQEDPDLIAASRGRLDPRWERSEIAISIREELRFLDPREEPMRYADRAAELFLLNPGAFQQNRLLLPVRLAGDETFGRGEMRRLRRALAARGIHHQENAPLELSLTAEAGLGAAGATGAGRTVTAELRRGGRELRYFRYGLGGRRGIEGLAATVSENVFRWEL
ncbi:MAG: transglutaminase domain-containing protein [Alkalispirochaetaceae bacterium]